MGKRGSCVYGPDLSEHEGQAAKIAAEGMKSVKGQQSVSEADKADGPAVSNSELNHFKPSKA